MDREIERGNNINLTNLLTLLGNVFPPEQGQPADATLHQALLAATMRTSQRDSPAAAGGARCLKHVLCGVNFN